MFSKKFKKRTFNIVNAYHRLDTKLRLRYSCEIFTHTQLYSNLRVLEPGTLILIKRFLKNKQTRVILNGSFYYKTQKTKNSRMGKGVGIYASTSFCTHMLSKTHYINLHPLKTKKLKHFLNF